MKKRKQQKIKIETDIERRLWIDNDFHLISFVWTFKIECVQH